MSDNGFINLQELDLSFNQLVYISENIVDNYLKILSISYNPIGVYLLKITNPKGKLFNKLQILRVENTSLSQMPDNNLITDLNQSLPQTLQVLDISGLNITNLRSNILTCPHLKYLYMTRLYYLTRIGSYAFYYLNQIRSIHLDNCIRLNQFNDLSFGIDKISETYPDHTLIKLSFQNCALTKLNRTLIHFLKRITYLNLYGNPWNCDCQLYQLFYEIFSRKTTFLSQQHRYKSNTSHSFK
ncbi:amphoterin-induced protein 2-like [Chrysoperla carnea]|uniref:amphoterin-induced protein 2-like n=1 Tax=Chrysoperla carnea TaxID=189513 RepID=UPI001D067BCF|nr:amphoterin-induced protein 2-like [Chrysoperla carnea]